MNTTLHPSRNSKKETGTEGRLIGLLALIAVLLYWLRYVLLPFVTAAALAYLTQPLVEWLHA